MRSDMGTLGNLTRVLHNSIVEMCSRISQFLIFLKVGLAGTRKSFLKN